jgi:hypothetical protein
MYVFVSMCVLCVSTYSSIYSPPHTHTHTQMPPRPHTQQGYRGGEIGARDVNKFNCRPLHQQWEQWHIQKQHEQQQPPTTKPVYVCTNIRNEELPPPPPPPPPPPQQLQQEQQKKQELHRGSNRPATKVERREAKEAGHGASKGPQRAQTIRVTIDALTGVHMPIPRSETWGGAHPPGAFLAPRTRDASGVLAGSHQLKDHLKESVDSLDILASSHLALSTNVSIAQKDPKSENPGGGRREAEKVGSSTQPTQPTQPVLWNTKTCQQRGGYVPLTKGGDGLLPVDKFTQEQKERRLASCIPAFPTFSTVLKLAMALTTNRTSAWPGRHALPHPRIPSQVRASFS